MEPAVATVKSTILGYLKRTFMITVLIYLTFIFGGVILGYSFILLWSLAKFLWKMTWKITGWSWFLSKLDHYMPEFTEEIRETMRPAPPEEIFPRIVEYVTLDISSVYSVQLGLSAVMLFAMLFLLKTLPYKKISYVIRGIQGEAMITGSSFMASTMPDYQVAIYRAGFFTKQFVGYGLRYKSYLVTPEHVTKACQGDLVISTNRGSYLVNSSPIRSRLVQDLVYLWVTDDIWSKTGVSSARNIPKTIAGKTAVSCTGPNGASSGILRKASARYMFAYSGSTLPGFSGASYDNQGQCVGIHNGIMGGQNIGTSSMVFKMEIDFLIKGEDSPSFAADNFVASGQMNLGKYKPWGMDEIQEHATRNWSTDAWDDSDIDYNAVLDFGEKLTGPGNYDDAIDLIETLSRPEIAHIALMCNSMLSKQKVALQTQGNESETIQVEIHKPTYTTTYMMTLLEEHINRFEELEVKYQQLEEHVKLTYENAAKNFNNSVSVLQNRIEVLEQSPKVDLPKVPAIPQQQNPFPCDKCGRSFRTEIGLLAHSQSQVHKTAVQGEAMAFDDHTVKTKTGGPARFLGKNYRRPRSPNYMRNLTSARAERESSSVLKALESMNDSIQTLVASLNKPQPVSTGPTSEKTPN